ncbi:MAG: Fic family protein [bacterium]|nr:Fic family protein [bacterium]
MSNNSLDKRVKLTPEILRKISQIDERKGMWHGGQRLNPQLLGRLKRSVIITSSGSSTRIEGSEMSDEEVARLLRGLKSNPPKNRDEQEVAGYADLLGRIFDNHETLKLSENNMLQFHSILLQYSQKDTAHRGRYKPVNNTVVMRRADGQEVVLFQPTKPFLVKPEMETAIDWANQHLTDEDMHPLLVIANFIFEFLAIHPFLDGNGRLSRALTNLLLLRSGYSYVPYVSLDELVEDNKTDYYLSLRATQKLHQTPQADITAWVNFLLDMLLKQAEAAKQLTTKEQPEKLLSVRQEQVYALFVNDETLGVAEIDSRLKGEVPQVTIKQALARLVELQLLEVIGQGRGTRYKKPQEPSTQTAILSR